MIAHIVLFKTKNGVEKEKITKMYEEIFSLKEKIPGIVSVSGGENISKEGLDKGFNEGFVMVFKDVESRDNYVSHEEHRKVVNEYILPIIDDVIVFDYGF